MNDRAENELLSAYLDGELAADEQAEVERLLAESPRARQLLEELRAVTAALQDLPQEQLGEDLSEQVLHEAKRRILTGEVDDTHPKPVPASAMWRERLGRMVTPRAILWPAAITAVAVLIMLAERPVWEKKVVLRPSAPAPQEPAPVPMMGAANDSGEPTTMDGARLAESEKKDLLDEYEKASDLKLADSTETPAVKPTGKMRLATAQPQDAPAATPQLIAAEPDTVLVYCDVDASAFRNRAFDRLLTSNGIAVEDAASSLGAAPASPTPSRGNGTLTGLPPQEPFQPSARADKSKGEARVDLVYVEAPQANLDNVLAAVNSQVREYPAVKVEPPAAPLQQALTQYSRGRLADGPDVRQTVAGENQNGVSPANQNDRAAGQIFAKTASPSAASGPQDALRGRVALDAKDEVRGLPRAQPSGARDEGIQSTLGGQQVLGQARRIPLSQRSQPLAFSNAVQNVQPTNVMQSANARAIFILREMPPERSAASATKPAAPAEVSSPSEVDPTPPSTGVTPARE